MPPPFRLFLKESARATVDKGTMNLRLLSKAAPKRRTLNAFRVEAAIIVTLAAAAAAACATPSAAKSEEHIGSSAAALTSAEGILAAQKAMDFLVPDAVAFTNDNTCLSCHRQPDVLLATSIAAALLPNMTLDTSAATGTGRIANLITGDQLVDGSWTFGGGTAKSMTTTSLWALAGYARAGGAIDVLPNVKRGLLWLVPFASTKTFATDDLAFSGQSRTYINNDFGAEPPQMFDWYLPTVQGVFATRVLLDLDTTLASGDVSTLSAQQSSFTDTLEGTTMRELTTTTVQHLALTALAMAESGRGNTANALSIGNEIIARQTVGSGWADLTSPDNRLRSVNALTTGEALYALCRLGIRPRANATVGTGLDWLSSNQLPNGSWALPGHDFAVATSWALLSIACASNPSGTAQFEPLTANGAPQAPVTRWFRTTLNVVNTSSDPRNAIVAVTGGPVGAIITLSSTAMNLLGDESTTVTVDITLPAGLPASTTYPFIATVDFAGTGPSSQARATFTVAIGATTDPALNGTTTSWSAMPILANVGTEIPLRATVVGVQSQAIVVGTMTFKLDGVDIATVPFDGSKVRFESSWITPNVTFGPHTLTAAYLGSNGAVAYHASSADYVIDIEPPPPVAPSVSGAPEGASNDSGAFPLSGTGTPGDTISITANGVVVGTTTVGSDGQWSSTVVLSPGAYALAVTESNAGGSSVPTTSNVSVQPQAPTVTPPPVGTSSDAMVVSVAGTATPGATITVRNNGMIIGTTTADSSGHYATDVSILPGPNNLLVSQTVSGQTSSLSGATFNRTPAAPSVSPLAITAQQSNGTILRGTSIPGATITVLDDGMVVGTATAGADGSYAVTVTLKSGQNNLVVQSSVGGIAGASSAPVQLRVDSDPPKFTTPPQDVVVAPGSNRTVTWPAITAMDEQDGVRVATCDHQPGEIYPAGVTKVKCVVTDSLGNASAFDFNVVISDPPGVAKGAVEYYVPNTSAAAQGCSMGSRPLRSGDVVGLSLVGLALAGARRRRRGAR